MAAWFEYYHQRYQEELDAFAAFGILVTEDEDLKAQGILRLTLQIEGSNPLLELPDPELSFPLIVVYPDSYPWFRPEAYAYTLDLPRHQHASGKNLCLIPRDTRFWNPEQLVADLLRSQLKEVLTKGVVTDEELVRADPQEQAEPYSDYYGAMASVMLDTDMVPDIASEKSTFKIADVNIGYSRDLPFPSRMGITSVFVNGIEVNKAPDAVQRLFSNSIKGVLFESDSAPPVNDTKKVIPWLKEELRKNNIPFKVNDFDGRVLGGSYKKVIGIRFPEEVSAGIKGKGWIFYIEGSQAPRDKFNKIIDGKKHVDVSYYAKPAYLQFSGTSIRVPRLAPLTHKTISLAGLGAIGSFVAIELARSGIGQLNLLDFDIVDHPTTVRWVLGLPTTARLKYVVLKEFIEQHFPMTKVKLIDWRIGSLRLTGKSEILEPVSDEEKFRLFISDTHLVIDTTAQEGINNYLNEQCRRYSLDYISAYATPGAWGGVVMRHLPKRTGCWQCMKLWQMTNPDEFVPPVDFNGMVQPPGCGDFTFTGTSFDLQNISMAAVRMAVSTLCSSTEDGYEQIDYDWAVLKLFNDDGHPILPTWKGQQLTVHPDCPYCDH